MFDKSELLKDFPYLALKAYMMWGTGSTMAKPKHSYLRREPYNAPTNFVRVKHTGEYEEKGGRYFQRQNNLNRRYMHMLKKSLYPVVKSYAYRSHTITPDEGRQAIFCILDNTRYDVCRRFDDIVSPSMSGFDQTLTLNGGVMNASEGVQVVNYQQSYFYADRGCTHVLEFANNSSFSLRVTVLDIECRRVLLGKGPMELIKDSMYNVATTENELIGGYALYPSSTYTRLQAVPALTTDYGGSSSALSGQNYWDVGYKPTSSKRFNEYFKIKNRRSAMMPPAAKSRHHFGTVGTRVFDLGYYSTMANSTPFAAQSGGVGTDIMIPGVTYGVMIIVHGMPGFDATSLKNSTTGPTLDILEKVYYNVKGIKCIPTQVYAFADTGAGIITEGNDAVTSTITSDINQIQGSYHLGSLVTGHGASVIKHMEVPTVADGVVNE